MSKFFHSILMVYQVDGIFVEYRAFDGLQDSHTLKLELNGNWTGLLIEPSPNIFQVLKSRHRLAWLANVCISINHPTMVSESFINFNNT